MRTNAKEHWHNILKTTLSRTLDVHSWDWVELCSNSYRMPDNFVWAECTHAVSACGSTTSVFVAIFFFSSEILDNFFLFAIHIVCLKKSTEKKIEIEDSQSKTSLFVIILPLLLWLFAVGGTRPNRISYIYIHSRLIRLLFFFCSLLVLNAVSIDNVDSDCRKSLRSYHTNTVVTRCNVLIMWLARVARTANQNYVWCIMIHISRQFG